MTLSGSVTKNIESGPTFSAAVLDTTSKLVLCTISGGTAGGIYRGDISVADTNSETHKREFILRVLDV